MTEANISVLDSRALVSLFGPRDQHLRKIREALNVAISTRGDQIRIEGAESDVSHATEVLEQLKTLVHHQGSVTPVEVATVISRVTGVPDLTASTTIEVAGSARKVQPRTAGQATYVQAIREHDLVLCTGPAGTGKTYLAVAM